MQYYHNPELYYNSHNIDQLELKNKTIVGLIKRDVGYTYCKLCRRPYSTRTIKYHTSNRKHISYHFYKMRSSSSVNRSSVGEDHT
jgi:hypothetical protein